MITVDMFAMPSASIIEGHAIRPFQSSRIWLALQITIRLVRKKESKLTV